MRKIIIIFICFVNITFIKAQQINDTLILNNNKFLDKGRIVYINHLYNENKNKTVYNPIGNFGITISSKNDNELRIPFEIKYIGSYNQDFIVEKGSVRLIFIGSQTIKEFKNNQIIPPNEIISILPYENGIYKVKLKVLSYKENKIIDLSPKEVREFLNNL